MVNYIRLACILRTYRKCNPTVGFSKYEFNNKLLGGVTFFFFMAGHKTPLYVSYLRRFLLVIAACWTAAINF